MIERIIAKDRFPQGHLPEVLTARCAGWSYSVEETPTAWIVRVQSSQTETDLDQVLDEAEAYPDFLILREAEVIKIDKGQEKSLLVRRGKHEMWCLASIPMRGPDKSVVGDKVLVGFIDGDRSMPVVVG